MSSWTTQRVLDAAAAMECVPDGAIELRTDDYRLIRYPDGVLDPSFARRAGHLVADDAAARRGHRRGRRAGARLGPARGGLVGLGRDPARRDRGGLRARGAELIDAVQILARELGGELPQPGRPRRTWCVELVRDERTFRAASAVTVQGWGTEEPDEAELASELEEALGDLATWSSFRVVASSPGTSPSRPAAARWPVRRRGGTAVGRGHAARRTAGAAATAPCSPSGCGWPASTARRWPWSRAAR